MPTFIDLKGQTFGRLLVVERAFTQNKAIYWRCKCNCEKQSEVFVQGRGLRDGITRSCGCLQKEWARRKQLLNCRKHGEHGSSEWKTWAGMIVRCSYSGTNGYHNYGGRGIKVCDRWLHSYENFLADMGRKPSPKHSIDRIDVDGNYEPSNCRWSTGSEQCKNKRIHKDKNI